MRSPSLFAAPLLLLFASSAPALGLPPGIACPDGVRQQLDRWDAADGGRIVAARPLEGARYLWPTTRLGVWLDLRVRLDGTASLARVGSEGTTELTWDPTCQVTARERPSGRPRAGAGRLTDADLAHRLTTTRAVVVYVWSPHMPLSVDGVHEVSLAAERLGLGLLARAHPLADPAYVARAAQDAGFPDDASHAVDSIELTFRDVLVHAPSLLLFVDGRAAGPAIPGYRDAAAYERVLRDRLASARRDQP